MGLGSLRTKKLKVSQKGTPQGSAISPLLINLVIRDLPERLKNIKGINHSIYADDLTVWMTAGAAGTKQDASQEAVYRIQAYPRNCGLACALEKSEMLIPKKKKRTRRRPPPVEPDPELTLNGVIIPKDNTIPDPGAEFSRRWSGNNHSAAATRDGRPSHRPSKEVGQPQARDSKNERRYQISVTRN